MKTSEYMDKEITGLSRSRSDDDFVYGGYTHGDYDYDESLSPRFEFYPMRPQGSADTIEGLESAGRRHKALLSMIDEKMKEHTDRVLHAVEGVSARLTQLENRVHQMENVIDDIKVSFDSHHGRTDGKLRELENLLREVENCTRDIRDKQDIAVAQIQLTKLALSKPEARQEKPETSARPESALGSSSSVPVEPSPNPPSYHPQLPPQPESALYQSPPLICPQSTPMQLPLPPYQTPAVPQLPMHQLHQQPFTGAPLPAQQTPMHQLHQQPFIGAPLPAQQTPMHQLHQQPFIGAPLPAQQAPLSVQLQQNEFHHNLPRTPARRTNNPFDAPFVGLPVQQYYNRYSNPPEQPITRPYSNFPSHPAYAQGREESSWLHNRTTLAFTDPLPSNTRIGYDQPPTARVLPQALPTVTIMDPEPSSSSNQSGSQEPDQEITEGVVAMGFRRDVVRAAVKRLTDRGQPVDLNAVLDMLANDTQFR